MRLTRIEIDMLKAEELDLNKKIVLLLYEQTTSSPDS